MNLHELIDAYGGKRADEVIAGELDIKAMHAADAEAHRLLAELNRRLALAEYDHPIMWRAHLDETDNSIKRQRNLLRAADKDRASGWPPPRAAAHVRADLIAEHGAAGRG
jgi:hypothetical protein